MFPTCKDLFDTSSSDDNSFYGFSKEEINIASKSRSGRKLSSPTTISVVTSSTAQVQVLHALSRHRVD